MKRAPTALLSAPFLGLYFAAVCGVALTWTRARWSSDDWFPIQIGLVAATAILSVRHLLLRYLLEPSAGDRGRVGRVVFFLICAILPAAAVPVFIGEDGRLALGLLVVSGAFAWASLGTMYQWPGFRPRFRLGRCAWCGYDLTGNTSGVCPECGNPIEKEV
jgi:hypothetical protein